MSRQHGLSKLRRRTKKKKKKRKAAQCAPNLKERTGKRMEKLFFRAVSLVVLVPGCLIYSAVLTQQPTVIFSSQAAPITLLHIFGR